MQSKKKKICKLKTPGKPNGNVVYDLRDLDVLDIIKLWDYYAEPCNV